MIAFIASLINLCVSQIWSEMQNDFLPNFILCNTTQRFIRSSKVPHVPVQKPSVPYAKPNFYCGTQVRTYSLSTIIYYKKHQRATFLVFFFSIILARVNLNYAFHHIFAFHLIILFFVTLAFGMIGIKFGSSKFCTAAQWFLWNSPYVLHRQASRIQISALACQGPS